jgi:hypothetical protein
METMCQIIERSGKVYRATHGISGPDYIHFPASERILKKFDPKPRAGGVISTGPGKESKKSVKKSGT